MERVNANNKKTSRKETGKAEFGSEGDVENSVRTEDAEGQVLKTRIGDKVFYRKGDRVCVAFVVETRANNEKVSLSIIDPATPVKPIDTIKNVKPGIDAGCFSTSLDELEAAIGIDRATA